MALRGLGAPAGPALKYPGAKWRIADWILDRLPPHKTYVEPFSFSGQTASRPVVGSAALTGAVDASALDRARLPVLEVGWRTLSRLSADGAIPLNARLAGARRVARQAAKLASLVPGYERFAASRAGLGVRSGDGQVVGEPGRIIDLDAQRLQVGLSQHSEGVSRKGRAESGDLLFVFGAHPPLDLVVDAVREKIWRVRPAVRQDESVGLVNPVFPLPTEPISEMDLPTATHENGTVAGAAYDPRPLAVISFAVEMVLGAADLRPLLTDGLFRSLVSAQRLADFLPRGVAQSLAKARVPCALHVVANGARRDAVFHKLLAYSHRGYRRVCRRAARSQRKPAIDVVLDQPVPVPVRRHTCILAEAPRKRKSTFCEEVETW